jgi:putative ABC transport system substrate-binding protein
VRRRQVIALIACGLAAWPFGATAQQPANVPKVGFLGAGDPAAWHARVAAFSQRLRELGWSEGRAITIEYRWAEGRPERFAEIAAEFVRLKVDAIVTAGTAAVIAAKETTSTVPIVFAAAGDPVASGLVASLARPSGNVTGLSLQLIDTAGKRLELLREVVPRFRQLAIIGNAGNPVSRLEMDQVQLMARTLGIDAAIVEVRHAAQIAPAIEALQGRVDALYVATDPLMVTNRADLVGSAIAARLPTTFTDREFVDAGGLMSYGPNYPYMFRRAAEYLDKILRGTRSGDIPVEQPTKFELVVNLKTAEALSLELPPALLASADEVIE